MGQGYIEVDGWKYFCQYRWPGTAPLVFLLNWPGWQFKWVADWYNPGNIPAITPDKRGMDNSEFGNAR